MQKFWKYFSWLSLAVFVISFSYSFFDHPENPIDTPNQILFELSLVVVVIIGSVKYRKYNWIAIGLVGMIISEIVIAQFTGGMEQTRLVPAFFALILFCVSSFRFYAKIYLITIGGVLFALFVMKKLHLPGAGPVLVISLGIPAIISLVQVVLSFIKIRSNLFLSFLCAACSLMLALSYTGTLFKWMHWPGANMMFYNFVSLGLFVALTITLILSVQITDITKWAESHRKFLVGNILIPWFFIFIWSCFVIIFGDAYRDFFRFQGKPWQMVDYEISDKPAADNITPDKKE